MPLNTSAWAFALLAIGLTALSINVSRLRLRHKVSLGDGGHVDLQRAVRAHGNALEQCVLFMLLLGVAEASGAGRGLPWVAGGFVAARVLHAGGMLGRRPWVRRGGHVLSVVLQLALAVMLLSASAG